MNVAILGLGIVGKGVYDLIEKNHKGITVKYVLEIDETKTVGVSSNVITDYEIILN